MIYLPFADLLKLYKSATQAFETVNNRLNNSLKHNLSIKERLNTLERELYNVTFPVYKVIGHAIKGQPHIKVHQGKDTRWYWSIIDSNGKYILTSRSYPDVDSVVNDIVRISPDIYKMNILDCNSALPNKIVTPPNEM